jgi:enoyl-CoA hydratase/carnithine racemase
MAERRHAVQIIDLADDEALLRLVNWLPAVLKAWSRDPELYAVAVRMHQGPVRMHQGPVRMHQGPVRMHQGPVRMHQGPVRMHEPPATHQPTTALAIADLVWRLHCCPKPIATFITGTPSSGMLALALAGTHCVAGEGFEFALTDVKAGTLPCGSLLHVLARLPNAVGVYLTLTGHALCRTDAYRFGLITHCFAGSHDVMAARVATIIEQLAEAEPIDPLLDRWQVDRAPSQIAHREAAIRRIFSAPTINDIVLALEGEQGAHADWARQVAADLRQSPPRALSMALATLQRVALVDVREAIIETYAANRALHDHEHSASPLTLPTRAALQSLRR